MSRSRSRSRSPVRKEPRQEKLPPKPGPEPKIRLNPKVRITNPEEYQKSSRRLYALSVVNGDGFDSAEALYWADKRNDLAHYILYNAQEYIRNKTRGKPEYNAIKSIGVAGLVASRQSWMSKETAIRLFYEEYPEAAYDQQVMQRELDDIILGMSAENLLAAMSDSTTKDSSVQVNLQAVDERMRDLRGWFQTYDERVKSKTPHLFFIVQTFDKGLSGMDFSGDHVVWADDIMEVVNYISTSMKNEISSPNRELSRGNPFSWMIRKTITAPTDEELLNISDRDLLDLIDNSITDGDSFGKVSISEYDPAAIPVLE